MSKFINIGNADFASVRKDEYLDKSQLIAYVNSVLVGINYDKRTKQHTCVIERISDKVLTHAPQNAPQNAPQKLTVRQQ